MGIQVVAEGIHNLLRQAFHIFSNDPEGTIFSSVSAFVQSGKSCSAAPGHHSKI
jgi:hypothetical protein